MPDWSDTWTYLSASEKLLFARGLTTALNGARQMSRYSNDARPITPMNCYYLFNYHLE